MISIATKDQAQEAITQLNYSGLTQETRTPGEFPKAHNVMLFIARKDYPHELDEHFLAHDIRGAVIDSAGYMHTFSRAADAKGYYEKITERDPATESDGEED